MITEQITSPHTSSRGNHRPELIVLHIADGTYAGTKAWFKNPASQISAHYIVAQDGRICQCVPLSQSAWCNGTTTDPASARYYGHTSCSLIKTRGGNANLYSISIELEGYYAQTNGVPTAKQLDATVWLIQHIQEQVQQLYGHSIPSDRSHIVGHCEITPKTRPHCPGECFPWQTLMDKIQLPAPEDLYRVQLGAFSHAAHAQKLAAELLAKGYPAFVVSPHT